MRYLLIFLLFCLSFKKDEAPKIDIELKPYVKEFLREAEHWRIPTDHYACIKKIAFVDEIPRHEKDSIVGQYDPVDEVIYIKNAYKDPRYVRLVVFHELGHAVFNLNHVKSKLSIMNPYLKYEFIEVYYNEWDYLVQDMYLDALRLENYRRLNENK